MAEVYRKGDARFGTGLEGSFFSLYETSLVILNLNRERGMEGKVAEWAYGGMTQGAQRSLPYPDISPLDGEIHVFPTLGTFLWYCLLVGNATNVKFSNHK